MWSKNITALGILALTAFSVHSGVWTQVKETVEETAPEVLEIGNAATPFSEMDSSNFIAISPQQQQQQMRQAQRSQQIQRLHQVQEQLRDLQRELRNPQEQLQQLKEELRQTQDEYEKRQAEGSK
jgi:peptidoglycan hydrolase CwlO-like protein